MKKFLSLSLVFLLIISLLTACKKSDQIDFDKFRGVSVNGTFITKKQIYDRIKINEIRNKAILKTFKKSFTDENQINTEYEKAKSPTEPQAVINELIKAEVLRKNIKNPLSYDTTKEYFDKEYALLKTDTSQKVYLEALNEVLKETGISEEEYLKLSYPYAYDFYNNIAAGTEFSTSNNYDSSLDTTPEKQFEDYVNSLIENSEIIYK